MMAQEERKVEEKKEIEEKKRNVGIHNWRRKNKGYKKMEWWKRCTDFITHFL